MQYGFFAGALVLIPNKFPALVIEDMISGETVPFDQNEEITAEKFGTFVERYFRDREKKNLEVVIEVRL